MRLFAPCMARNGFTFDRASGSRSLVRSSIVRSFLMSTNATVCSNWDGVKGTSITYGVPSSGSIHATLDTLSSASYFLAFCKIARAARFDSEKSAFSCLINAASAFGKYSRITRSMAFC